jgi:tetratricopeptide (TPR) repeat protein
LDTVLKSDPANVDALMFKAFIAIQQKDNTNALKLVDSILETNGKNVQALTYKGAIHMELKEDEKAVEAFNRALKIEPNNMTAIHDRAIASTRLGHLNTAKEDYTKLLAAYPKSHQFYWGLGEIAMKKNDRDDAVKNYELYLKYAPTNLVGEAAQERTAVEARLKDLKSNK